MCVVRDNHVTSRCGEHAHLHEQAVGLDAVFVVCRLEDDVDEDDDAVLYLHHVTDTDQCVSVCVYVCQKRTVTILLRDPSTEVRR